MKLIALIILLIAIGYILLLSWMYLYQRNLIYFPTGLDPRFEAREIVIDNQGLQLHGWVLNPGQRKAMIYFGGNSELITQNRGFFESVFTDYSIYLVNYRGYGKSQGKPSEASLFSDALAIYDKLSPEHESFSLLGRSLGSGIAVYLAAHRVVDKLVLLTPYDSIAAVAQRHYPLFPISWLIHDRFDSSAWAGDIHIPVLVISAEFDRVVPTRHSDALVKSLVRAQVEYHVIAGAAHNDINEYPQYRKFVSDFIAR